MHVAADELGSIESLTERVLAAVFEVSNVLGAGFLEKVYERGAEKQNWPVFLLLFWWGAEALGAADRFGAGGFGVDLLDAVFLGGLGDQGAVLAGGRGGGADAAVGGDGDGSGVGELEVIFLWADGVEGGGQGDGWGIVGHGAEGAIGGHQGVSVGPGEIPVDGGGGKGQGVAEFGGGDHDGGRPLGKETFGGGDIAHGERVGRHHEITNLLGDQRRGAGEGGKAGEGGGGTGEQDDGVPIELRGERVADEGHGIGGIVHLDDVAGELWIAGDGIEHGIRGGHVAGQGEADGDGGGEGARFAGVEADQHVGENGGGEATFGGADGENAGFVLALEAVEHGEGQGVVNGVAEVGVEDDADGRFALRGKLHTRWMLACRLEEEVGGLPIAHLADSLAMALGGGDVPLAGIDGGEQVGEFPPAAEAEVEGHSEEGCLGGCGIGIPVGEGGGERGFEAGDIGGDESVDIGVGHTGPGQRSIGLGDEAYLGGGDVGVAGLDFGAGGGAAIDGAGQVEGVGGGFDGMTDADGDLAAGAAVHVGHAAFKALEAGNDE